MTRARDLADGADKDITGTLTLDDIVLSNDMSVADNGKVQFGAGNDLQIYHDGSNSVIKDNGTGKLILDTDGTSIEFQKSGLETLATFNTDGAITLYHDNSAKLATTSTGIDVTGSIVNSAHLLHATNNSLKIIGGGDATNAGANLTLYGGTESSNAGEFRFRNGASEVMRIDSSGSVGIGTSSPSRQLHINNASESNIRLQGGSDYAELRVKDADNAFSFHFGASERMRIDSNGTIMTGKTVENTATDGIELNRGNVLVATRNNDAPLLLNRRSSDGDIALFRKDNTTEGSISVTASGTTYNTTSDRRLKTDINPIADATEKLMAMNPVTHRWIAEPDADAVHGFIAQDMQQICPEAVNGEDGGEDMMSMDYGRITPVLVAALQEANRKIDQLEQRIAEMENN